MMKKKISNHRNELTTTRPFLLCSAVHLPPLRLSTHQGSDQPGKTDKSVLNINVSKRSGGDKNIETVLNELSDEIIAFLLKGLCLRVDTGVLTALRNLCFTCAFEVVTAKTILVESIEAVKDREHKSRKPESEGIIVYSFYLFKLIYARAMNPGKGVPEQIASIAQLLADCGKTGEFVLVVKGL